MKSNWRRVPIGATVLLVSGLTACSDSGGPGDPNAPRAEAAAGAYVLQSVNAEPLPYSLGSFYGYELEYTSGALTLSLDNTFRERAIVTSRVDNAVVQIDTSYFSGKWYQGASITLLYTTPPDTLTATLKNGLLSYDYSQDTAVYHYIYKKQ